MRLKSEYSHIKRTAMRVHDKALQIHSVRPWTRNHYDSEPKFHVGVESATGADD